MPPGSIEQEDGVGTLGDGAGDLVEVQLHRLSVGEGQRQGRPRAAGRADRPEQVGALVALVGRLSRPRSASRPLPHEAVFLADPCLVLEPDLDRLPGGNVAQMPRSASWGSFFERLQRACILPVSTPEQKCIGGPEQ